MRFVPLLTLRIAHPYYSDGRCSDFTIEPSGKTEGILANHRSVLKSFPDGIRVLAAADESGAPFIPFNPGSLLVFHLRLRNPDFPLFTDLAEVRQQSAPLYSNLGLSSQTKSGLELSSREAWSKESLRVTAASASALFRLGGQPLPGLGASDFSIETPGTKIRVKGYDEAAKTLTVEGLSSGVENVFSVRYPVQARLPRGVFADVELEANESLPQMFRPSEQPRQFQIQFQPRLARWAYYFVTDLTAQPADIGIVDTNSSPSATPLSFSEKNRTDLNQTPVQADQIATLLSETYPQQKRIRFLSDDPVPLQQSSRKHLELQLGGDRLIDSLPNPSPANYSVLEIREGSKVLEQDTLFQVVKYLKHPIPKTGV